MKRALQLAVAGVLCWTTLALGQTRDEMVREDRRKVTEDGFWIYNDLPKACLLYTSPSPRDQRGSRMPSSA